MPDATTTLSGRAPEPSGITDEQLTQAILWADKMRIPMATLFDAMAAGAHLDEMLEARSRHLQVTLYLEARAAGWSHADLLDGYAKAVPLEYYPSARAAGATHAEILDATRLQCATGDYLRLRSARVPHREIIEFASRYHSAGLYWTARQSLATHAEIMEAAAAVELVSRDLPDYAFLREDGVSHRDALKRLPAKAQRQTRRGRRIVRR